MKVDHLESQFLLKNIRRLKKEICWQWEIQNYYVTFSRSHLIYMYVIESAPHANHSISGT
jgi:hypothetical protein